MRDEASLPVSGLNHEISEVLLEIRKGSGIPAETSKKQGEKSFDAILGIQGRASEETVVAWGEPGTSWNSQIKPGLAANTRKSRVKKPAVPSRFAAEPTTHQKKLFWLAGGGASVIKFGIDALNIAVPLLLINQFHNATMLGLLYVFYNISYMLSGIVSGPWIDKVHPSKAVVISTIVQALSIAAIPVSFSIMNHGALLPVLIGLYVLNGAAGAITDISRRAVLPHILGQNETTLREYNARLYLLREVCAVAGAVGAGLLLSHVGYLNTLWMHPAS